MKRYIRDYSMLLAVAAVLVALDQWTKMLVRTNLEIAQVWSPEWLAWLTPYARIVHWTNTGVAFGMLQGRGSLMAILAILIAIAIAYYYPQVPQKDWTLRLAMGMMMGGALGNLTDRLMRHGEVTDFISVGSFAVFNVADACISVGVAVMLLGMYLQERKRKMEEASLGQQSQDASVANPEEPTL